MSEIITTTNNISPEKKLVIDESKFAITTRNLVKSKRKTTKKDLRTFINKRKKYFEGK